MAWTTATAFEWDKGNIDKSYRKHGITPNEAEEVFLDTNLVIVPDISHSKSEERQIAIGKSGGKQLLFVVFTLRKNIIRIISARQTNGKERRIYENKNN